MRTVAILEGDSDRLSKNGGGLEWTEFSPVYDESFEIVGGMAHDVV